MLGTNKVVVVVVVVNNTITIILAGMAPYKEPLISSILLLCYS